MVFFLLSPVFLGAFVVCWTPGLVVLLLDGLNCTDCGIQNVKRWFLLLALLNSVMNPIIYSYKDDEMWATMKRMICCSSEDKSQERRSSRIPSTVLCRSTDTSGHYIEDGIIQGTICGKGDLGDKGNSWAMQGTDLAGKGEGEGRGFVRGDWLAKLVNNISTLFQSLNFSVNKSSYK